MCVVPWSRDSIRSGTYSASYLKQDTYLPQSSQLGVCDQKVSECQTVALDRVFSVTAIDVVTFYSRNGAWLNAAHTCSLPSYWDCWHHCRSAAVAMPSLSQTWTLLLGNAGSHWIWIGGWVYRSKLQHDLKFTESWSGQMDHSPIQIQLQSFAQTGGDMHFSFSFFFYF
jgi:hypothetical protein